MTLSVLHVLVPEPPGEVGGADMHVRDLATYQAASGMAAAVIERGSPEYAHRMRAWGIDVASVSGLSFRSAVARLADEIATRQPDVVHAHGYDADYWAAATRWRHPSLFGERAVVFTQHGIVADTLWHKSKTVLDAVCMRAADGIIVCAEALAPRMSRWSPNSSVRYIANGVMLPNPSERETARQRLGLPNPDLLIGYVGRLSPEKRPDRVLTLVAAARQTGIEVHAAIVGSGGLAADLRAMAKSLNIAEWVHFTGRIDNMGDVYGALDALVLLSDTETTSRVVIEAMGTRVPVIASSVGSVPELLGYGDAGHLVPRSDDAAALAALQDVVRQPDRFVDAAYARSIGGYVVDVMGRATESFYREVLASLRAPVAGKRLRGPSSFLKPRW